MIPDAILDGTYMGRRHTQCSWGTRLNSQQGHFFFFFFFPSWQTGPGPKLASEKRKEGKKSYREKCCSTNVCLTGIFSPLGWEDSGLRRSGRMTSHRWCCFATGKAQQSECTTKVILLNPPVKFQDTFGIRVQPKEERKEGNEKPGSICAASKQWNPGATSEIPIGKQHASIYRAQQPHCICFGNFCFGSYTLQRS